MDDLRLLWQADQRRARPADDHAHRKAGQASRRRESPPALSSPLVAGRATAVASHARNGNRAEEGPMSHQPATTDGPARRDFGRIFRKPDSRFYWVRYRVGGKEYVESSRSESVREAEKLLARKQAELGVGIFVAPDVKR